LELERQFIERTEFSAVRKGYDPDEVDRHLREIAAAVEELKRSRQPSAPESTGSLAGAAADQVRAIVEAAEGSATEIEAAARAEADRVTGEAKRAAEQERNTARGEAERVRREAAEAARETRERAETEAAEHLANVQDATSGMRERADTVEADLQGLVDQLRGTIESVVESVRTSAGSLEAELESIHGSLEVVREPLAEEEETAESAPFEADTAQPTAISSVYAEDDEPEAVEQLVEEEPQHPDDGVPEQQLDYEEELDTGEVEEIPAEEPAPAASSEGEGAEGARLIALNMALNGTPREETARYLEENFNLEDQDGILDEVYARVGG
jgi:DivIVA domain-containing protein